MGWVGRQAATASSIEPFNGPCPDGLIPISAFRPTIARDCLLSRTSASDLTVWGSIDGDRTPVQEHSEDQLLCYGLVTTFIITTYLSWPNGAISVQARGDRSLASRRANKILFRTNSGLVDASPSARLPCSVQSTAVDRSVPIDLKLSRHR